MIWQGMAWRGWGAFHPVKLGSKGAIIALTLSAPSAQAMPMPNPYVLSQWVQQSRAPRLTTDRVPAALQDFLPLLHYALDTSVVLQMSDDPVTLDLTPFGLPAPASPEPPPPYRPH